VNTFNDFPLYLPLLRHQLPQIGDHRFAHCGDRRLIYTSSYRLLTFVNILPLAKTSEQIDFSLRFDIIRF